MSDCNHKNCDCHQNSSFIFGLILGLIIAAVVAVVIYRNNKEKVFSDLKKYLNKFISSFRPKSETIIESFITPDITKRKIIKKKKKILKVVTSKTKIHKKEVTIPKNLIIADSISKPVLTKPRKMFKKV